MSGRQAKNDVLAEAQNDTPDLVVEIKYGTRFLAPTTGEWVLQAARISEVYSEASERYAEALLWVIHEITCL